MIGDLAVRAAIAACRWLQRVYSPRFAALYAEDMALLFQARLLRARRRGIGSFVRCVVVGLSNTAAHGVLDRLDARRGAARAAPPASFIVCSSPSGRPRNGDRMIARIGSNLRFAARKMLHQPLIAGTIVATLAIGTGSTIALFGIVDAALLRPLPYPQPRSLVTLVQESEEFGTTAFAPPFLDDLRERSRAYSALAGFSSSGWSMTLTGAGEPRVVAAAYVSDALLPLLGVNLAAGRDFTADEHVSGGSRVALVTRTFWNRHFGPTTELNDHVIRLGATPHQVVGVLPEDFRLPITGSIVGRSDSRADLLLPFAANPFFAARNVPVMNIIGRLADAATAATAAAELQDLRAGLDRDYPGAELSPSLTAMPLIEFVGRRSRATVLVLFAAAGLLLLIASANVANLLLAQATGRRRELGVRASLGASRLRLVEQMLTESLLLASAGCAAGSLLALWTLRLAPSLGLSGLPPSAEVRFDARVAGFAMLLAALTAIVFGLAPALAASRRAPFDGLSTGNAGAESVGFRGRDVLVIAEVAMALVLLVGAGLLARSFWRLTDVDPGFRTEGFISVPLSIGDAGYETADQRRAFMREFVDRVGELPGVEAVAAVNRLPLGGSNVLVPIEVEGLVADSSIVVDRRVVTPAYFAAMGISLRAGRPFDGRDDAVTEARVAIVNEDAARRFWPDRQAVGRRLRLMLRGGPGPWLTVVGVAGDVRHHGLDAELRPEVYVPFEQASVETMVALVRGADPDGLAPVVQEGAWRINPDLALDRIVPLETIVARSVAEPRLRTLIFNAFAALAATLAAVGIAGVVAYSVARRSREIAIRVALGAEHGAILADAVGRGLKLGVAGAALGILAAVGLGRFLRTLLFEITPSDPVTLATVTVALLVLVAAASYLPARRVTRVDPVVALRAE